LWLSIGDGFGSTALLLAIYSFHVTLAVSIKMDGLNSLPELLGTLMVQD
jgi:hypothetical protein